MKKKKGGGGKEGLIFSTLHFIPYITVPRYKAPTGIGKKMYSTYLVRPKKQKQRINK